MYSISFFSFNLAATGLTEPMRTCALALAGIVRDTDSEVILPPSVVPNLGDSSRMLTGGSMSSSRVASAFCQRAEVWVTISELARGGIDGETHTNMVLETKCPSTKLQPNTQPFPRDTKFAPINVMTVPPPRIATCGWSESTCAVGA